MLEKNEAVWDSYWTMAQVALTGIERAVKSARDDMEQGVIPASSLVEVVTIYDRALSALGTLRQLEASE